MLKRVRDHEQELVKSQALRKKGDLDVAQIAAFARRLVADEFTLAGLRKRGKQVELDKEKRGVVKKQVQRLSKQAKKDHALALDMAYTIDNCVVQDCDAGLDLVILDREMDGRANELVR